MLRAQLAPSLLRQVRSGIANLSPSLNADYLKKRSSAFVRDSSYVGHCCQCASIVLMEHRKTQSIVAIVVLVIIVLLVVLLTRTPEPQGAPDLGTRGDVVPGETAPVFAE